ncbi:hypothetical protein SEVIR_9G386050v4 [Setaria viridis]
MRHVARARLARHHQIDHHTKPVLCWRAVGWPTTGTPGRAPEDDGDPGGRLSALCCWPAARDRRDLPSDPRGREQRGRIDSDERFASRILRHGARSRPAAGRRDGRDSWWSGGPRASRKATLSGVAGDDGP